MASLIPQDLEFAETAPVIAEAIEVIEATPAELWAVIVDYERWPKWFSGVNGCRSTSTPATGVGSTREVTLAGGMTVAERFIGWEDQSLWAFTAIEAPPVLSSLVERVTLLPVDASTTQVAYRMAFAPRRGLTPVMRLVRPLIERNLGASLRAMSGEVALRRGTPAA